MVICPWQTSLGLRASRLDDGYLPDLCVMSWSWSWTSLLRAGGLVDKQRLRQKNDGVVTAYFIVRSSESIKVFASALRPATTSCCTFCI